MHGVQPITPAELPALKQFVSDRLKEWDGDIGDSYIMYTKVQRTITALEEAWKTNDFLREEIAELEAHDDRN